MRPDTRALTRALSALAISTGLATMSSPSASARVVIENNFPSGSGNLTITMQENGITDTVSCTGSSLTGKVANPPTSTATLNGWTWSGCTASSGGQFFGAATVAIQGPLPSIKALSQNLASIGAFVVRVRYKVNGTTCTEDVSSPTSSYNYISGPVTNQISGSATAFFSYVGAIVPPDCLSAGAGTIQVGASFPDPQLEVAEAIRPRVAATVTSLGALSLNYTGTATWTSGNPPSGTVSSVSVANHPQGGAVVGVVGTNGVAYVKQGSSGSWVSVHTAATAVGVASDANGPLIAVLGTDGHVYAKRGLTGVWNDEISGATSVAIASDTTNGPVLGATSVDGHAYAKQGLTGVWHDEYAVAASISVATDASHGPYIAVVGTDHHAYVKQGLTGAWIDEIAGADKVSIGTDATNGPVIGVLGEDDHAYVKQGLTGAWTDESTSVSSLAVAGSPDGRSLVGVVGINGSAQVKRGLSDPFVSAVSGAATYAFSD